MVEIHDSALTNNKNYIVDFDNYYPINIVFLGILPKMPIVHFLTMINSKIQFSRWEWCSGQDTNHQEQHFLDCPGNMSATIIIYVCVRVANITTLGLS